MDWWFEGCGVLVDDEGNTAGQHLVFIPEMAPSESACVYGRNIYGMKSLVRKG